MTFSKIQILASHLPLHKNKCGSTGNDAKAGNNIASVFFFHYFMNYEDEDSV